MGNTGSLQEMHANCQGDLASYCRNSRIRTGGIDRSGVAIKKYQEENSFSSPIINYEREINNKPGAGAGDWAKSFPRTIRQTANSTNESPLPHFKVLPHLNESLKLRTTANGAILHSGGTISGRREQQQHVAEPNTRGVHQQPIMMQRSRTIIYERGGGAKQQQQNAFNGSDFDSSKTGVPVLRRAQTQFHLNYKDSRQHQQLNRNETQNLAAAASGTTSRSEPDLRHNAAENTRTADIIATPTNRCSKNTKATNKYNKKRKAPAAPANVITASTIQPPSNANAKTNFVTPSTSGSSRRQSITVNNKGINVQKKTQTSTTTAAASSAAAPTELALGKSRIFLTKAETDSNIAGQRIFLGQKKLAPPVVQQLPYRREKSFDSTLLYERRTSQKNVAEKEHQQLMSMQNDKREDTKIPQPHRKRTFYFGMDTRRTAAATTNDAEATTKFTVPIERRASPTTSSSSESIIMTTAVYDISISPKQYDDDNDNCNGLQVHVRPMLPRRQMNIPRFSPAAAWRMLTEEQQNLQLQRQSMKVQAATASATAQQQQQIFRSTALDTLNNEQPIHPVCKLRPSAVVSTAVDITKGPPKKFTSKPYAMPWTPQQDLEDDDDDHSSSDEFPTKTNSNSLFLVESSSNIAATKTEGKDNLTNPNGNGAAAASVHVFSLSLPRDGHFGIGFCDNKPLSEKVIKTNV